MSWPRKIFIESTALFQLGSRLEKPEFAKLLERRDLLKFDLLVSEVSWLEFMRQRKKKIAQLVKNMEAVKERLGEWDQNLQGINDTSASLQAHGGNLENLFAEKAKTTGIRILPLSKTDVSRLMRMSIECVPPFEQSDTGTWEKGFRDSLIMFTILEDLRKRPEDNGLVISADELLKEGLRLFANEFETRVDVVKNLDDAIQHIDERLSSWYRDHLRRQSQEAQEMLLRYGEQISEQVRNIRELSDVDLGVGGFAAILSGRTLDPGETVEKVHSLAFKSIESAIWKGKDGPVSSILFRIRCAANVATSVTGLNPFFASEKFIVGGEKQITAGFFGQRETRQRVLTVRLYGKAQFKRQNGDWELSELRVDKSPPPPEELAALSRGEL